jgi:hypothetical protein
MCYVDPVCFGSASWLRPGPAGFLDRLCAWVQRHFMPRRGGSFGCPCSRRTGLAAVAPLSVSKPFTDGSMEHCAARTVHPTWAVKPSVRRCQRGHRCCASAGVRPLASANPHPPLEFHSSAHMSTSTSSPFHTHTHSYHLRAHEPKSRLPCIPHCLYRIMLFHSLRSRARAFSLPACLLVAVSIAETHTYLCRLFVCLLYRVGSVHPARAFFVDAACVCFCAYVLAVHGAQTVVGCCPQLCGRPRVQSLAEVCGISVDARAVLVEPVGGATAV